MSWFKSWFTPKFSSEYNQQLLECAYRSDGNMILTWKIVNEGGEWEMISTLVPEGTARAMQAWLNHVYPTRTTNILKFQKKPADK